MVALLLAGCSGLPTDPAKPTPKPLPIPQPSQISTTFASKVDTMAGNVFTEWKRQASVSGVEINGSSGVLGAGDVKGPTLNGFFTLELGKISATDSERRIIQAFSSKFSSAFAKWQASYAATLTYTGFDAVQAAMAPATANAPLHVMAGTANESDLTSAALAAAIKGDLGTLSDNETLAVDAAAIKLANRFQNFKSDTKLKNIIGSGNVPGYNPPFSPSGPVVNGTATGAPGAVFQ
jgi:hypothetical protein